VFRGHTRQVELNLKVLVFFDVAP